MVFKPFTMASVFSASLLVLGLTTASGRVLPERDLGESSRRLLTDGSYAEGDAGHYGDLFYSTADPALSEGEVHMVLNLFETWNDALATGDSATVADLYAPNAVLLPTVSNDVRTDRAGIIDYFDKFLQIDPVGVINEYGIREEAVDDKGKASVISNSGIYTFTSGVDGSKTQARFTYVYEKIDGEWLILSHHSSQMPTELEPSEYTGEEYLSESTGTGGELTVAEEAGVLEAFDEWNTALKTYNPDNMLPLYTHDAILLPTVADDVRTTDEGRRDYFVGFMEKEPTGVIDEHNIRLLGRDARTGLPNAVSNQGIYTFTFTKTGEKAQARFTYNYVLVDGKWLIKEHHSSAMPEATEA